MKYNLKNIERLKKWPRHSQAHRVLKMTQERLYCSNAIIAGGFVRDLLFDIPHTDVDIFISENDYQHMITNLGVQDESRIKNVILKELQFSRREASIHQYYNTSQYSNYAGGRGITSIFNLDTRNPIDRIQFIFVDRDPIDFVMETFDIGLCKIFYDGKKIRLTTDFLHDADNNLLTINGKNFSKRDIKTSMRRHVPKLKKKYPNFKVEIDDALKLKYSLNLRG